jgi:hypothetical protein
MSVRAPGGSLNGYCSSSNSSPPFFAQFCVKVPWLFVNVHPTLSVHEQLDPETLMLLPYWQLAAHAAANTLGGFASSIPLASTSAIPTA